MGKKREVESEVADSMRRDWDLRAQDDPFYAIGSSVHHEGFESFYLRGEELVASQVDPVLEQLHVDPSKGRVLEIGCGMGRLFPGLARRFARVAGVDISTTMIARGKAACPVDAEWTVGSGRSLEAIESSSVDYVISFEVFQHIPDREIIWNYLSEIERVLKPEGCFQVQMRQASDTRRQAIVGGLPRAGRVVVARALKAIEVTPVEGDIDTWLGTIVPPAEALRSATAAGLTRLEILPDEVHLPGMGYWLIGKRGSSTG